MGEKGMKPGRPGDPDFDERRAKARDKLEGLAGAKGGGERQDWFTRVYREAGNDPAMVPWADLSAKPQLVSWLEENPGSGEPAIDVACGLGDNAEAIAGAGYDTIAFDMSEDAIRWAIQRFPGSQVEYRVNDLFDMPSDWEGAFALVHECFTIQALQGELREKAFPAITSLVAPGGTLIVIAWAGAGTDHAGPPWPLTEAEMGCFESLGLERIETLEFEAVRAGGKVIPHQMVVFSRPD